MALRIGICIATVGVAIFLGNLTASLVGFSSHSPISIPADGRENLVEDFSSRPYEIRLVVPDEFKGTLTIFDYEGIRGLTKGIKTPLMKKTTEGPMLVDFTPNRRGAYMMLIESKISKQMMGSINLVEKEAVSQDMLGDSLLIISFGLAIVAVTFVLRHR